MKTMTEFKDAILDIVEKEKVDDSTAINTMAWMLGAFAAKTDQISIDQLLKAVREYYDRYMMN